MITITFAERDPSMSDSTGWEDTTAGIKEYHYQLFEMLGSGDDVPELKEDASVISQGSTITSGQTAVMPRTGALGVRCIVSYN